MTLEGARLISTLQVAQEKAADLMRTTLRHTREHLSNGTLTGDLALAMLGRLLGQQDVITALEAAVMKVTPPSP